MSKILKALAVQEKIEGKTEDLALVKAWYGIVASNSSSRNMFNELVKIKFHKYGKSSFESYRFYYPTPELKALLSLNVTAITDK